MQSIISSQKIIAFLRTYWLWLIIALAAILRFYNLNWDGSYIFHPDELNIAVAVDHMTKSPDFNPDFFAYGTMPIGLIFLIKTLFYYLFNLHFDEYVIGRVISASVSLLSVFLVYVLAKMIAYETKIKNLDIFVFIPTFILAFSPAAIQAAHYMTFESVLAFEYLIFSILSIKYLKSNNHKFTFFLAIVFGLSVATKVTSLFLLVIFICLLGLKLFQVRNVKKILFSIVLDIVIFILVGTATIILFFPHMILDWAKFVGSINYENSVANGSIAVFYTRQFIDTVPIIFQLEKVLPFLLGNFAWVGITLIGIVVGIINIRKFNGFTVPLLFIVAGWLPTSFLFVKWLRYSVYFLPFFAMFAAYGFLYLTQNSRKIRNTLLVLLLILFIFQSFLFFGIYIKPDSRITAARWAEKNIELNKKILSESYDLGIVPFNAKFIENIKLYDFYALENNSELNNLAKELENSDYFISPSGRLSQNSKRLGAYFPLISNYYSSLERGALGFELVYDSKTSTDYLGLGYNRTELEETFNVFDHPIVKIYKKVSPKLQPEYVQIISKGLK